MSFKRYDINNFKYVKQKNFYSNHYYPKVLHKEKKINYFNKINEQKTELERIYGANLNKHRIFQIERKVKNNTKIQDNNISNLNISNLNKMKNLDNKNYKYSKDKTYNYFVHSEYIYIPCQEIPPGGWIQHCIFCNDKTSCIENINKYKLYCCNRCQKKYNYNDKIDICDKAIKHLKRIGY